ncbi:MAG: 6-hydroxycyclohex-1-ene-1-carbonyl-CoA dehydrogenase [Archangiaceae bacterium]|nr:6-hydroxycyclohex-1-ene-1-carbonyl-CoA dehydrogenase [Archangiaceae bacterium]
MTAPSKLERFERDAGLLGPHRVLVEVAGCGVCHTDIGFLYGGVSTKKALPIVLGHEVSGVVVDAAQGEAHWLKRRVIVPAVAPCGRCGFCFAGRPTSCRASLMPGNDEDGGFATHVEVPASTLCAVDAPGETPAADAPVGRAGLELWELSVVADAVSTPLQAIRRCGLKAGELAVVVGAGGVGSYAVQLARAVGATVAAVDPDPARRARAIALGARACLDPAAGVRAVKTELQALAREAGLEPHGWRIFETSGAKAGQELAFSLLTPGGSLSVVGFTPEPTTVKLSSLMALDATAYGNWGCSPSLYPEALAYVASGQVQIRGQVKKERLDDAPRVLEATHHGELKERAVLVP